MEKGEPEDAAAEIEAGGRRKEIADEACMKLGVRKSKDGSHSFVSGGYFFVKVFRITLDKKLDRCYNLKAVRADYRFDINDGVNPIHTELVLIAMRVHLFPSRTQKLSSFAPTILGG